MNKFKSLSFIVAVVLLLTACPGPTPSGGKVKDVKATAGAGNIKVEWTFEGNEADIQGFQIYRNPDSKGAAKYGPIGGKQPANARSYTDDTANDTTKTYKYGVAVIDKDGKAGTIVNQPGPGTKPNPVDENTAPVATPDSYSVIAGQTLTIAAPGVLDNDTDANDDDLTAILVGTAPTGLTLNANGGFTYNSTGATAGTNVTFTYKANDGKDDSNTATVTIAITASAPDLTFTTISGLPIKAGGANTADIDAHYASGLPAGATIVGTPPAGLSAIAADGSFTYTGPSTTFDYTLGEETSTVTITVNPTTFESVTTAATLLNNTKDIVYIPTGTTIECTTNCTLVKAGQKIIGAGADLTAADLGIDNPSVTQVLVAKVATKPTLRSSTEQVLNLAGGATIKGLTIRPSTGGFGAGIFAVDSIEGDILVEDTSFIGGKYGIAIRETSPNNVDGGKYTLTVKNVTITNPTGIGIFPGDARTVTITDTTITGAGTGVAGDPPGSAIRVESEFTTSVNIDTVTIKPRTTAGPNAKFGIVIFKNNAFAHAATDPSETMTVAINNSSIELGTPLTDTVGIKFIVVGAAFDDVPPLEGDVGIMNISGSGNKTNAALKADLENTTGTVNGFTGFLAAIGGL